jgi:hypothetical protein
MDELLALCREQGIEVILVVTPEGTAFRRWYGPAAESRLTDYLSHLSQDLGLVVVDARDWLPDDAFYDSHHVVETGARIFTQRLNAEVLRPLLEAQAKETRP